MKRSIQTIALLALLAAVTSCQRMPLYDMVRSVVLELQLRLDLDLRLDVDVDADVEATIKMPRHMKVLFYQPTDGRLQYTEFVDSTGGPIATPAGTYHMLVYSFGTEYTQIRGETQLSTIEAFTSDITQAKAATLRGFTRAGEDEPEGSIVYPPDHLLVASEAVCIPEWVAESQTVTLRAEASTIVETYSFEVRTVVGAEYIESCEAFVTNQARSCFFGRGEVSTEPATLSFPVGIDRRRGSLFTTFNTFGKLPGESRTYLYILVRDTGGQEYHIAEDITDQFDAPDHRIVIDDPVSIPKPDTSGGGIAPTVDPWDEEQHDVPIG